jgi:glycosyltransferase involved in cell wall biosynthesis
MKYRIAVVNTHPVQYFAPLYSYLNKDKNIEITCFYCSSFGLKPSMDRQFGKKIKWDIDLLDGYKSIFLSNSNINGFFSLINLNLIFKIKKQKFDVVWIHGYNYFSLILVFIICKFKKIPIMFRGETHLELKKSYIRQKLHNLFVYFFFRKIDKFLSIGSKNKNYYSSYGVNKNKIFEVPYTIDNDRYMSLSNNYDEIKKIELKNELNINLDAKVILFASKFMKRKHPELLVESALRLKKYGYNFHLLMLGDGELREDLENFVKQNNLSNCTFTGFINQSEIPKYYSISDIFVLPSENEPWGLVVNEAMCAGLPIILNKEIGCTDDLLYENINGLKIDINNKSSLENALKSLLKNHKQIDQMSLNSKKIIKDWNFEKCKKGIINALFDLNR